MKKLKFIFDVSLVVFMPMVGYIIGFWLYFWEWLPSATKKNGTYRMSLHKFNQRGLQ